ncbi:MAG: nucleotide-binding universal stress UspA family protein [Parvicellaceae bacterium]|jgi:nucleotide-binding universal stress UspA family protein
MKKILFPYESIGSEENAFIHAAEFAQKYNAELIILHAFTFPVDDNISQEKYQTKLRERWIDVTHEIGALKRVFMQDYLHGDRINFRFSYTIVFGKLIPELHHCLKTEKVDLLVLSTPYFDEERSVLTGSSLQSLLEKIKVPVLTVPANHKYEPIKKIAYATDLKRVKGSADMLTLVEDLAKRFKAKLNFVHISMDGKLSEVNDKLTLRLMESKVKLHPELFSFEVYRCDSALKGMSEFVKRRNVDMVVVIRQTRNFFESMFHESFSNQISVYSKEPVLILNDGTILTEDFLNQNKN